MKNTLRFVGIAAVLIAVSAIFIGAIMKINNWAYANTMLTIGFLSGVVAVGTILILLIRALSANAER